MAAELLSFAGLLLLLRLHDVSSRGEIWSLDVDLPSQLVATSYRIYMEIRAREYFHYSYLESIRSLVKSTCEPSYFYISIFRSIRVRFGSSFKARCAQIGQQ